MGAPGAAAQPKTDWEKAQEEREWKETEVRLPPYPKGDGLVEFFVSGSTSFRFYIDPASLAVGPDGVVRYTLVARSPSGVDNVTYEGIRCSTGLYKIFAAGNDGRWTPRSADWRAIEPKAVQRWHNELRGRYFCPLRLPIQSAAEGLSALRQGGHPAARNDATGR